MPLKHKYCNECMIPWPAIQMSAAVRTFATVRMSAAAVRKSAAAVRMSAAIRMSAIFLWILLQVNYVCTLGYVVVLFLGCVVTQIFM